MDFVISWGSKIGHITTDQENSESFKTRCGHTIKNSQYGVGGEIDCERCGTPEKFAEIRRKKHEDYVARQEESKTRQVVAKERSQLRLQKHREIMANLQAMLKDNGAEILDVKERAAGGNIEFKIDGLKFKLGGNIW